jgi:hypothetical protein
MCNTVQQASAGTHGKPASILPSIDALLIVNETLDYPASFNASNNPHRTTEPDPYLQYPYDCCGPNNRWAYPCREPPWIHHLLGITTDLLFAGGYEKLLGTPEGAPTATWLAGSTQNWSISGIGNHYGGSCQVGFSTDRGASFHVATSYEGNCPHRDAGNGPDGQEFEFAVPTDISAGTHIFAWIWYNREQELNMNCAAVEITSPSVSTSTTLETYSSWTSAAEPKGTGKNYETANGCSCDCESPVNISTCSCVCPARAYAASDTANRLRDKRKSSPVAREPQSTFVAFSDRPLMFVADNGNDCITPKHTAELKFPNPGPNVVKSDGLYPLQLPSGECGVSDMLARQSYDG